MKRLALLAICIFLLSGCTTSYMVKRDITPEIKAKSDAATLVIIRDTSFGFAIVFWNYLDGKLIGETKGSTYFVTQVKPGPHYVVVTTENTAVAHLDFQQGKTYYLREGVLMGWWRARTSGFEPLTHQQAMESMKECTYWELDASKITEDMDPKLYRAAIDEYHAEVKQNPGGFKSILEYKGY
ncbi:MAG: DUF2846 domain-containing protein [Deltaproteobacteria bacterium]|nr:DUF2846 domain-containing protein [Deltaproteobacteria bacterium]